MRASFAAISGELLVRKLSIIARFSMSVRTPTMATTWITRTRGRLASFTGISKSASTQQIVARPETIGT